MDFNDVIRERRQRLRITLTSEVEPEEADQFDFGAGPRTPAPLSDPNRLMNQWLRQTWSRTRNPDPHNFDGDRNGVGCEARPCLL